MKITNKLNILKAELLELYPNADHEIFFRDPKNDVEFIHRYLPNKLWRLNNLYTITDKMGNVRPFIMNRSQHRVYEASLRHARLLILKSRQQGISTFWLLSYFDDALFEDHLDIGLMSQGRSESGTLLTRTKLAWDKLDGSIKKFLRSSLKKDNADEIALSNGSTIFIRTSFRSATLQRLHISEYGKICNKYPERAKETKTGTMQAIAPGNSLVIESTAEGDNDFKRMWDKAYGKDPKTLGPKEFLAIFLSWLDDESCVSSVDRVPLPWQEEYFDKIQLETGHVLTQQQKNFWIDQYNELEESAGQVISGDEAQSSSIYQEYPSTPEEAFKALRDGAYYAGAYNKHIINRNRRVPNLYDHNLEVEVVCDLGMDDFFVLVFFQKWQNDYRIVHEYVNNGEGLKHYVAYMLGVTEDEARPIPGHPCENFIITNVYLPWDAEVRDLDTGLSRKDRVRDLSKLIQSNGEVKTMFNTIVLPKLPINTGIELVRKLIPNIWIDESCEYIHGCMLNYHKQWDERLLKWKDKPVHDEWSHGADTIRGLAVSRNPGTQTIASKSRQKSRRSNDFGVTDGMSM